MVGPYSNLELFSQNGAQTLLDELTPDMKDGWIEVVGVDTKHAIEQGNVNPVSTAPSEPASDPNVEPKARRYNWNWNGFNKDGALTDCQDSQCQYCARQDGSRWHGFGTEVKAIDDKNLYLLEKLIPPAAGTQS